MILTWIIVSQHTPTSNYGRVRKHSNRVQTGYDNKFSLFLFYFIFVCLLIYFRVKNVKIIIGMTYPWSYFLLDQIVFTEVA